MTGCRRCTYCDLNWPNGPKYEKCPRCKKGTWLASQEPMGESERKHVEFDVFYESWEKRQIEADIEAVQALPEAAV